MCDEGCKEWKIEANPAANPERIKKDVPFWLETGNPCDECVRREFELLYNRCTYGRCKRERVGPQGGCDLHAEHFTTPEGYQRPENGPENAQDPSRITPYHRTTKKAAKKEEEPKDEAEAWAGYSESIDLALGREKGPDGKWVAETPEQRACREAEAIKRMAHNIEHAWD